MLHTFGRGKRKREALTSHPFILSGPLAPAITSTEKSERGGNLFENSVNDAQARAFEELASVQLET
jgi:hypothetical protein